VGNTAVNPTIDFCGILNQRLGQHQRGTTAEFEKDAAGVQYIHQGAFVIDALNNSY